MTERQTFAVGETIRQRHLDAVDAMSDEIASLRARVEVMRELIDDLTCEPLNQDEQGGCVWCGGSAKGRLNATESPKDHGVDCAYIAARQALKDTPEEGNQK